jgi:CBS domain-containing protein
MLTVNDAMQQIPVSTDPETTIEKAVDIMKEYNTDYLPVIENEELIGIFTRYDLEQLTKKKFHYDPS